MGKRKMHPEDAKSEADPRAARRERQMTVLAWHWCSESMRTQYTNEPIVVGDTLRYDGKPILCQQGLHASTRILDALGYAPGPVLCRVRLGGVVVCGYDKIVATERTVLWAVNAQLPLVAWAADCAHRALERERAAGREPDARSWAAVEAARAFAADPSDANHKAAEIASAAARDATRDAAWAARAAASAATSAAARDAAWIIAWDTARDAISAARAATRDAIAAERQWQSRRLRALIGRARRGEPLVQMRDGGEVG